MKRKYKTKETGYIVVTREIQKLLKNKEFTFSTLGAYLCLVLQADWDKRHEIYRAILPDDKQLAELWSCSISSVFRNKKKLLNFGLIEIVDGDYYIKNVDIFKMDTVKVLSKKENRIENLHEYYSKSESSLWKIMMGIAKTESDRSQNEG